MTAPDLPSTSPRDGPALSRSRGRRLRKIQLAAYAVSALVHVLALFLYPRLFGGLPDAIDRGAPTDARPPSGIEIVNLIESASPDAAPPEPERELERTPIPVPVRPRAAEPAPDAAAAADRAAEAGETRNAAERLQPRTRDGRLWAPLPEEITALTDEQRIENLLYARLQDLNDSTAAAAARALASTDWTHTDENGNKWGVSPGKLHLGPVTLPLPFSFGTPPGATGDLVRLQQLEAEIRRAAGQGALDETAKERADAIRKRRDEERRRTRPDTTVVGAR
jgi:hypothetical protein